MNTLKHPTDKNKSLNAAKHRVHYYRAKITAGDNSIITQLKYQQEVIHLHEIRQNLKEANKGLLSRARLPQAYFINEKQIITDIIDDLESWRPSTDVTFS